MSGRASGARAIRDQQETAANWRDQWSRHDDGSRGNEIDVVDWRVWIFQCKDHDRTFVRRRIDRVTAWNPLKLLISLCPISQYPRRRGVRVVEGARLESVYTGNGIAGSNPALSAFARQALRQPLKLWRHAVSAGGLCFSVYRRASADAVRLT